MSSTSRRALRAALVAGIVVTAAAGCAPAPSPALSPSASTAPSTPAASPSVSADPVAEFTFPASCDELYSPEMRAILDADIPPLNDPGTTMLSTENGTALDVLDVATESLRCSWGPPSERGMATTVTVVTPEQRDELFTAFEEAGFSAEDLGAGTIHRIQQETVTQDDEIISIGETHYLNGEGWVATRWINVAPEGYTEDIVASLWG